MIYFRPKNEYQEPIQQSKEHVGCVPQMKLRTWTCFGDMLWKSRHRDSYTRKPTTSSHGSRSSCPDTPASPTRSPGTTSCFLPGVEEVWVRWWPESSRLGFGEHLDLTEAVLAANLRLVQSLGLMGVLYFFSSAFCRISLAGEACLMVWNRGECSRCTTTQRTQLSLS